MATWRKLVCDRKGMVLFSSLLLVSLLMVAGMGAWMAIQNDYRITSNLRQSTAGFYFAEAGIEWSKQQIGQTVTHPPKPADRIQSFSYGKFSVTFVSSTAVTPLTTTIVLRSTGVAGASSQTVEAQITKIYDLADAAIGIRGVETSVMFSGNSFLVSGFDHDAISGAPVTGTKPRLAISTPGVTLPAEIEAALASLKTGSVVGGENNTAISQSDFVPSPVVARIAEDLCRAPHATMAVIPVGGTLSLAAENWGSRSAPQLRCIEGLFGTGDAVRIGEKFSGVGILVVRNAELVASGDFRWEGLVIITGEDVGFRVLGNENKEVYGALMINQVSSTAVTKPTILEIHGTVKVLYSRSALARVAELLPPPTLSSAYPSLPSVITQDYWRSLNP